MKINEVEALTKIPKKSIRYYEAEGLLQPQRESGNGYRCYGEEEVKLLKRIRLLRKLGLPVEEIRRVFQGELTLREALERQAIALAHERNDCERKSAMCQRLIDAAADGMDPDTDVFLENMEELEKGGARFYNFTAADHGRELRGVWLSCLGVLLFLAAYAGLIFFGHSMDPLPRPLFIIIEAILVLAALGAVLAGRARIKEIKGGEEDDLGKY